MWGGGGQRVTRRKPLGRRNELATAPEVNNVQPLRIIFVVSTWSQDRTVQAVSSWEISVVCMRSPLATQTAVVCDDLIDHLPTVV